MNNFIMNSDLLVDSLKMDEVSMVNTYTSGFDYISVLNEIVKDLNNRIFLFDDSKYSISAKYYSTESKNNDEWCKLSLDFGEGRMYSEVTNVKEGNHKTKIEAFQYLSMRVILNMVKAGINSTVEALDNLC